MSGLSCYVTLDQLKSSCQVISGNSDLVRLGQVLGEILG